jgi:hypothetical protein
MDDLASPAFLALCNMLERRAGLRYATVLSFVERDGVVHGRRDFTTVPDVYPTGTLKPLPQDEWLDKIYRRHQMHVANGADAIRATYPDHDTVFALGAARLANFPIVIDGRCRAIFNVAQADRDDWEALAVEAVDAGAVIARLLQY